MDHPNEAFQREILNLLREIASKVKDIDERTGVIEERTRGPSLKSISQRQRKRAYDRP